MADILETLILASERAACIARSCRTRGNHEALLVAEKSGGEANTRFDKDFKTIADVLAQESAKTDIGTRFPKLAKNVRGEECSDMGGITISVQESPEKTADLLASLVPAITAKCMAEAAHKNIDLEIKDKLPKNIPALDPSSLGVWIDPIDATAEFIAGVRGEGDSESGLPCVTVLIGAYLRSTGEPVMGVINQPFYDDGKGRIIWGVCYDNICEWSGSYLEPHEQSNTILMSSAERPEVANVIRDLGWNVKSIPGAGNKLMKVVLGEAAAYIVTKGTTFRWDTCAPHSILRAKGGNLLNISTKLPVTYNDPEDVDTREHCNSGGIIAFADKAVYDKIKNIFNV